MTIELITTEQHDELLNIYKEFPELTLQNNGYQYIDRTALSTEAKEADKKVTDILKKHVQRFSSFSNFRLTSKGELQIRLQYGYDESFTGVGYILLSELLNGFNN